MDDDMPELNGMQAVQAIREDESYKHCRRIPIVVITARLNGNYQEHGFNGRITKPILFDDLKQKLETFTFMKKCKK